jgi:hypothetical protein
MTHRRDLEAAQVRAEAAEPRAAAPQRQVHVLERAASEEPVVPMPERFEVARNGDELTIAWRWFKAALHPTCRSPA